MGGAGGGALSAPGLLVGPWLVSGQGGLGGPEDGTTAVSSAEPAPIAGVEAAVAGCGSGRAVRNPEPERGQLSSLQCGLRALAARSPRPEWFLFAPVDCFDVTAEALAALREARRHAAPETLFCIPEYRGKHGHPVAARWAMAEAFLALAPSESARTVVRSYRDRSVYVPMAEAGTLLDYDTPEAFGQRGSGSAAPVPGEGRLRGSGKSRA